MARIDLNPRQRRTIRLLCNGLSNKEISNLYKISEGTVRSHIYLIARKLKVKNRTEIAIRFVHQLDLLEEIKILDRALETLKSRLR